MTGRRPFVLTKGHVFRFAIDNGCQLITLKDERHPRPLSPGDTHALLNLLYINRADILTANEEAASYFEQGGSKRKRISYV